MENCKQCGTYLDPENEMLWNVLEHTQERTGYDGTRDWIQEWITLECASCKATNEISDAWIVDPRTEDN